MSLLYLYFYASSAKEAEAVVAAGIEIERHLQRLLDDVATLSRP